jgi:hypothetical protein
VAEPAGSFPSPIGARIDGIDGIDRIDGIDVIGELVHEMRAVVDDARDRDDRNGYFAALYLGVTSAVERGLRDGIFTTPDRLSQLTATFARRYLDALELHLGGGQPAASWQVAFDAAATWRPTLLQHLLLGINAHINLDLGAACAEVAPGPTIIDLEPDFEQINAVLAGLVAAVQDRLNRVSPLYRFVDDIAGDADHAVVNFSIARARHEAWRFATELAPLDAAAAHERIARQDAAVARLAQRVLRPGAIAGTGLLAVRLTERRSTSEVITLLVDTPAR